ncbi:hypothetical protein HDU67_009101 [Dinochytrium kinnereticum]|nr:hypothetical protein HDU67_009101 [Dinochytrium kinnereticum]
MSKDKDKALEQWVAAFKRDLDLGASDLIPLEGDKTVRRQLPQGSRIIVSNLSTALSQPNVPVSIKERVFEEFSLAIEPYLPVEGITQGSIHSVWNEAYILVALSHFRAISSIHPFPPSLLTQFWSSLLRPILLGSKRKDIIDLARESILALFSKPEIASKAHVTLPQHLPPQQPVQPQISSLHEDTISVFGATLMNCWMSELERIWASFGDRVEAEILTARGGISSAIGDDISSPIGPRDITNFMEHTGLGNVESVIVQFAMHHPEPFVNIIKDYCLQRERRLHALALLNKSVLKSDIIQHIANSESLFQVLVQICLHDIHPASVSGALNILTLSLPYSIQRLAASLDLLFLVLTRTMHWDVLTHIIFKVISPSLDGGESLVGEALSPWSVDIEMDEIDKTSLPETFTSAKLPDGAGMDVLFEPLPDMFAKHILSSHRLHPNVVNVTSSDHELRIVKSASFAQIHPPAELLSQSFSLRVPRSLIGKEGWAPPSPSDDHSISEKDAGLTLADRSVGGVAREVILLNRKLRQAIFDLTPSGQSATPTNFDCNPRHKVTFPVLDLMRLHQLLLLNEINLECSIRQGFLEAIMMLRKQNEMDHALSLDRESVYQKLKQQQHELGTLTATVDQLKVEANATRERYRKYEEDFNRRLRTAREGAKEAKEELGEARTMVAILQDKGNELSKELDDAYARISELENDRQVTGPRLNLLAEYEQTVKSLTEQLSKEKERMTEELSTKVALYEQQIDDQGKTIREQERVVASVRANASSKIEIVEEKCKTLKQINQALEDRILELEAVLERASAQQG